MISLIHSTPLPFKGFFFALFLCLVFMPIIIQFTKKNRWFDNPNRRKIHKAPIPTMGGIVIFLSMLIVAVARPSLITSDIAIVLIVALALFITGIYDDLNDLRPRIKLYIQIVTASIIVFYGIKIDGLEVLGIEKFGWPLSTFISVLCIVFFINAFNLIDGIDGLAGGLSIIALSTFSALFYFAHVYGFAFLSAALAGSCLGFLFFNFSPARIFMGDTGSLTIGFFLAVFSIRALQLPENIFYNTFNINTFYIVFALVFLPSLDAARVFMARIIKGLSPFKPDRTHIHHLMLNVGMTHKSASLTLYFTQIIILSLAIFPQLLLILGIFLGILVLATIVFETYQFIFIQKRFLPYIFSVRSEKNKNILLSRSNEDISRLKINGKNISHIKNDVIIKTLSKEHENLIESNKVFVSPN